MAVQDYRQLHVWQQAMDLVVLIYQHCKCFPKEEIYGLTSASSHDDFRVNRPEFDSCVADAELPIDAALFGVRLVGPGSDFRV